VRTGFLFGMLNVGVALWTIRVSTELKNVTGRMLRACAVLCALVFGFAFADKLTYWGEHGLFGDEIVFATTTPYQRLVITRWKDDLRLYINGNLQFSSRDEYRYHEALVHPVLQPCRGPACWCWAAATAWRCAKSCVIRISSTSRWWTSTRP
jgi:spermidine synthase